MNPDHIKNAITPFIRVQLKESGASGAVIGLSGGIDSAVAAYLSACAIGHENVLGILLPVRNLTPEQDGTDAIDIANRLGIEYKEIEISDVLQSFSGLIPDYDLGATVSNGNLYLIEKFELGVMISQDVGHELMISSRLCVFLVNMGTRTRKT